MCCAVNLRAVITFWVVLVLLAECQTDKTSSLMSFISFSISLNMLDCYGFRKHCHINIATHNFIDLLYLYYKLHFAIVYN